MDYLCEAQGVQELFGLQVLITNQGGSSLLLTLINFEQGLTVDLTPFLLKAARFHLCSQILFLMNLIKRLKSVDCALSAMPMTVSFLSEASGREIE